MKKAGKTPKLFYTFLPVNCEKDIPLNLTSINHCVIVCEK